MSLLRDGFAIVDNVLSGVDCQNISRHLDVLGSNLVGTRCLLEYSWCRELAVSLRESTQLRSIIGMHSVAVQCTYFQKSASKNWLVAWHQDLSIPVKSYINTDGWSCWSKKEGMIFVQPPLSVLTSVIAVRIHIDTSLATNGTLKVLSGTHVLGKLSQEQIVQIRQEIPETVCIVEQGGALVMNPLLLHSSSKSATDAPRRVLHFLYAHHMLPNQPEWRHTV